MQNVCCWIDSPFDEKLKLPITLMENITTDHLEFFQQDLGIDNINRRRTKEIVMLGLCLWVVHDYNFPDCIQMSELEAVSADSQYSD